MQQEPVKVKVNSFLKRYGLYGKTFVVGFSGGYDSLCLLHVLSGMDIKIIAAHFNHGWRVEADEEESRCRCFCTERGIEFFTKHAASNLKRTENDARIARYEFFEEAVRCYSADGIFTAHNKDDNAETVLYRIIKGTGIRGLCGISEQRGNIYRPVLNCTRMEIENYCKTNNLLPNIDISNNDTKYRRNFLRHKVLPLVAEINPGVKSALNNLSALARLDESILGEYLNTVEADVICGNSICVPKFLQLNENIRQRLIYNFILNYLSEYDIKKIKELLEFINKNSKEKRHIKMSLSTDLWLSVNREEAVIYRDSPCIKNGDEIKINGAGKYEFAKKILTIEECNICPAKYPSDMEGTAFVDFSEIKFPLTLRYGKSHDIITPYGMRGKMLFKKYLSGKSIPEHLRSTIIILAKNEKVLWVPYNGISEDIKVRKRPTHILNLA